MIRTTPADARVTPPSADAGAVAALAVDAGTALDNAGRGDLAQLVETAAARVRRPAGVICVVGEFKQGKSSLVNELIGRDVCPVDDDLATSALTLLHFADDVEVVVRRREGERLMSETIHPADLADWVSERGNESNWRAVERVEVGLPAPFLHDDAALVDTPGAGGMHAGHAAAVLGFLPFADAVLFVTDASAELSRPEVDFLGRARAACPTVLVLVTKIDLYPEWRRMVELDRGHLHDAGLAVPVLAVSSFLHAKASRQAVSKTDVPPPGDDGDADESGFDELRSVIRREVSSKIELLAVARAVSDIRSSIGQVADGLRTEVELLDDPERSAALLEPLSASKARLEHLRGPGARWATVLGDGVTDLTNRVGHEFRAACRTVNRNADAAFETAANKNAWEQVTDDLQAEVADAVAAVFVGINEGAEAIQGKVIELLREEELSFSIRGTERDIDVADLWDTRTTKSDGGGIGAGLESGFGLLRGAMGPVMIFGLVGRLMPAVVGEIMVSNPFTIGAGVLFGVKTFRDERKRRTAQQRQAARVAFRQFVEEVQFEVNREMAGALREAQRTLRDEFSSRITELQRTVTETLLDCEEDVARSQSERDRRRAHATTQLASFDALLGRAASLGNAS